MFLCVSNVSVSQLSSKAGRDLDSPWELWMFPESSVCSLRAPELGCLWLNHTNISLRWQNVLCHLFYPIHAWAESSDQRFAKKSEYWHHFQQGQSPWTPKEQIVSKSQRLPRVTKGEWTKRNFPELPKVNGQKRNFQSYQRWMDRKEISRVTKGEWTERNFPELQKETRPQEWTLHLPLGFYWEFLPRSGQGIAWQHHREQGNVEANSTLTPWAQGALQGSG